ncbi:MAG: hypothetical protein IJC48_06175 [Clostridia bacterium]|nr:hypothetical protein [Clostridia bacterium]
MAITKIMASRDEIIFTVSGDFTSNVISEYVPIEGGRLLSEIPACVHEGEIRIPRFDGARDRLLSKFRTKEDGVCFVSDLMSGASENAREYPQPEIIKALHGTEEDVKTLGLKQTLLNINILAIMTVNPKEETIDYECGGKTYHFIKSRIEEIDEFLIHMTKLGLITTLILLNSPRLFNSTCEEALLEKAVHPDYEWNAKDAFLSGFNMVTEEGQGYYQAFVEFLAERYSRADRKYGCAMGMIISNEVDSQCVWSNSGEKTAYEFTKEYTQALRIAWLLSHKHYANYRIYISLDQFFSGMRFRPTEPLHTYPGREVIDLINEHAVRDGNFGWFVAYHPYPEDLRYPDFWNDRAPNFTFSTPKITFKNMEVLPAYLAQERLLYEGKPRRIIFSEQGFNSQSGALQALTEKQAAAAYVLAYIKARSIDTCDLFTHHAYRDNPHEFGLNLGIRRYDETKPGGIGEKKPIYESVRKMDTEEENEAVQMARSIIGDELFDYLLKPQIISGEAEDLSTSFG